MGLDLYHYIPIAKNEVTDDFPVYFSLNKLSENQAYIEKHQSLHTEIDEVDVTEDKIIIFKNSFLKEVCSQTKDFSRQKVLIGTIEELEDKIRTFEIENGFDSKQRAIIQSVDNILSQKYRLEVSYTCIAYYFPIVLKVICFKDIGYQRKGMSRKFYEDFENDRPYFQKFDVIKASSYLDSRWGRVPKELRTHFETNFIDNFLEGESIFFGDW